MVSLTAGLAFWGCGASAASFCKWKRNLASLSQSFRDYSIVSVCFNILAWRRASRLELCLLNLFKASSRASLMGSSAAIFSYSPGVLVGKCGARPPATRLCLLPPERFESPLPWTAMATPQLQGSRVESIELIGWTSDGHTHLAQGSMMGHNRTRNQWYHSRLVVIPWQNRWRRMKWTERTILHTVGEARPMALQFFPICRSRQLGTDSIRHRAICWEKQAGSGRNLRDSDPPLPPQSANQIRPGQAPYELDLLMGACPVGSRSGEDTDSERESSRLVLTAVWGDTVALPWSSFPCV